MLKTLKTKVNSFGNPDANGKTVGQWINEGEKDILFDIERRKNSYSHLVIMKASVKKALIKLQRNG